MKITFAGCNHNGKTRPPNPFVPLIKDNERTGHVGSPGSPMQWWDGLSAKGYLRNLDMSTGEYFVEMEFQEAELKNWLKTYIEHHPAEALEMIAEVLSGIAAALKKQ